MPSWVFMETQPPFTIYTRKKLKPSLIIRSVWIFHVVISITKNHQGTDIVFGSQGFMFFFLPSLSLCAFLFLKASISHRYSADRADIPALGRSSCGVTQFSDLLCGFDSHHDPQTPLASGLQWLSALLLQHRCYRCAKMRSAFPKTPHTDSQIVQCVLVDTFSEIIRLMGKDKVNSSFL